MTSKRKLLEQRITDFVNYLHDQKIVAKEETRQMFKAYSVSVERIVKVMEFAWVKAHKQKILAEYFNQEWENLQKKVLPVLAMTHPDEHTRQRIRDVIQYKLNDTQRRDILTKIAYICDIIAYEKKSQ